MGNPTAKLYDNDSSRSKGKVVGNSPQILHYSTVLVQLYAGAQRGLKLWGGIGRANLPTVPIHPNQYTRGGSRATPPPIHKSCMDPPLNSIR